MRILKKLAIGLVVVAVVLAVAAWWIVRGDPADYTVDEVSGTDPIIAEPDPQWIPTVGVAQPIGWGEDGAPEAAEGLVVNRFAEGLRSEEHTSELQSRENLVCRLLLEKKKKYK